MEKKKDNVQKCKEFLTAAKSDNEKFAALLMIPKVIKSEELSAPERVDLLKSIGIGFLVRLLKSKSVPDGCSEHVYRSVAFSILSGLVKDNTMIQRTDVYKVLPQINDVLQTYYSDTSEECQVIMDDAYDILRVFTESVEGIELLITNQCIKCLVNLIIAKGFGSDKAVDLCLASFVSTSRLHWIGHGETIHDLLNVLCYNMHNKQDEQKFILCDTVAAVLRCLPEEQVEECADKAWYKLLVRSLSDIFTSKISAAQREPALKLAAVAIDCVGVKAVLPPCVQDSKLLLIITHLCCIEVRMMLETYSYDKVVEKAEVLCSCYQVLEHVIGHMTSAPSLQLDDKQILQLHTAMLGAFNAVVCFLKESSERFPVDVSLNKMPDPVVIATVRVLGAWLAEETSALKKEIYDILPYLVQICKVQILLSKSSSEQNRERKVQFDITEEMESCSLDSECDNLESEHKSESTCTSTSEGESRNLHSCVTSNNADKHSLDANATNDDNEKDITHMIGDKEEKVMHKQSLSGNHSNVDVIRLLLPGLCHLSAEDEPRKILLKNDAHELLIEYFRDAVSLIIESPDDTLIKSSVELLCGIFLNITVQEPILVSQDQSFHTICVILMEASSVLGKNARCITVWANMVTLGMFLLRSQPHVKLTDGEVLLQFFVSACQFIKRAYIKSPTVTEQLLLSESYNAAWEDIGQLWFLCVQTTSECIKLYPSLIQAVLSTGLLPHITKVLLSVNSNKCEPDVAHSFMSLLSVIAATDQKARDVLNTTGGDHLARLYRCTELQNILK